MMSRRWARHPEGFVRRVIVTVLVVGVVNGSAPAFAAPASADEAPPPRATVAAITPSPPSSLLLGDQASRHVRTAIERSLALDARAHELTTQSSAAGDRSGHWCPGGLALLAGGVTAAIVSGVRREENAQKPNPPVGVVLGTAAAAVGGIMMIRTCKR
jgi:hypothetical protein